MSDRHPTAIAIWGGRILSTLVVAILLADAAVNLFAPKLLAAEMEASGFPVDLAPVLGTLMLLCVAVYAYPRTAVLGAILVTGLFGGAICVHFRMGEIGSPPQLTSLLIGLLAWAGLILRDAQVRAVLMPWRGLPETARNRQLPVDALR
jgi:hypothetical protein